MGAAETSRREWNGTVSKGRTEELKAAAVCLKQATQKGSN